MFVKWNESYSVGVKFIDEEHKKLLEILNKHYDGVIQEKDKDFMLKTMEEMRIYTKTHFGDEERYMQKYNYGLFEMHKKEHEYFISEIQEFENSWIQGHGSLSTDISLFLKKWLLNHISIEDKKVGLFLNNYGIR